MMPLESGTWPILGCMKDHYMAAVDIFAGRNVIMRDGRPHTGTSIGSKEFMKQSIAAKVDEWCSEIDSLVDIACTLTQAAFTHGLTSK